ncbi:MAG: alpha/beta hydrolase [Acidobacteriota bacterium]|nr:alpha/beta hydrolase [Acidobacteriota bacterium]
MTGTWTHREDRVNGVRLHWVEQGEGPLVVLLHGFPEFWYAWRHQIPALAAAGFRAVAPDLRGYNLSEKPAGVVAYRIEALLADLAGLVELLGEGEKKAHVVGHDWGGALAWYAPLFCPEKILSLTQMNAPHPLAFRRELKTNPAQRKKSSYIFLFQLPWIPERRIRAGNFAVLEKMLRRDPVTPGTFSDEDVRLYKEALGQPGALTAAINYYRAAFRFPPRVRGRKWPEGLKTLLIWGMRDRYLGPGLLEGLDRWVPNLTVERIPDASHWVQADAPARVNEILIRFLTSVRP